MGYKAIEISDDFCGGNIKIISSFGDEIHLTPDLRGGDDWFYWAFCIKNANGKTINFDFDGKCCVGYFGPAISHDLEKWKWHDDIGDSSSFSYTFSENESAVYFAHHMLYHPKRFAAFANKRGLELKELCISEKGRSIPYAEFGSGSKKIMLTARHHACESTGNYFLEGVLDRLIDSLPEDYSVFCVPFVDYDGSVDGDQGKNRYPHDHNRDYNLITEPLYNSVKQIRDYALSHEIAFGLDFHSPWHFGGRNDKAFIVHSGFKKQKNLIRFAKLFEKAITDKTFVYCRENDCPPDFEWNKMGTPSFSQFTDSLESSEFGISMETAYFGEEGNAFSESNVIETGKCFAYALHDYIKTKNEF